MYTCQNIIGYDLAISIYVIAHIVVGFSFHLVLSPLSPTLAASLGFQPLSALTTSSNVEDFVRSSPFSSDFWPARFSSCSVFRTVCATSNLVGTTIELVTRSSSHRCSLLLWLLTPPSVSNSLSLHHDVRPTHFVHHSFPYFLWPPIPNTSSTTLNPVSLFYLLSTFAVLFCSLSSWLKAVKHLLLSNLNFLNSSWFMEPSPHCKFLKEEGTFSVSYLCGVNMQCCFWYAWMILWKLTGPNL